MTKSATNCFNCGEPVPDGQNYCGQCGAPQNLDPGVEYVESQSRQTEAEGSKTWLWILIGCGGLSIAACCLGLVLMFSLSGAISGSAVQLLNQAQTVQPELLDEGFSNMATMLPEFTQQPADTPEPSPTAGFSCGEFGLTIDPRLQVTPVCERQEAQNGTDFMGAPAFTRIQLTGYPVAPTFHEAQISVYPVQAYRGLNQEAASRIDQLQELIQNQPERAEEPLPFLPVWNANQMTTAQFAFLRFRDGQGIRYLTQYGQAAWPINNEDLFYTFQGLTSDGEHYISVILPITHPDLPADGDAYIWEDYDGFIEGYALYLDEVAAQLDASSSKSFRPSLAELDAVIETFSIR